jgi:carboxypeptidase D
MSYVTFFFPLAERELILFATSIRSSGTFWARRTSPTLFNTLIVLTVAHSGVFSVAQAPVYFDRTDVKKAIHAPTNVAWEECGADVFVDGIDASLPSSLSVLPKVIDQNVRTVIVHGMADYVLIADGTRIAIQK